MRKKSYRIRVEPWSAVRLVTQGTACTRATALTSRRFLAREAPALPLKGCTRAADCSCRYNHYADRRSGPRRDADVTGGRNPKISSERRGPRDRRRGP
ncbi:MAG TPA: hypothetical protein VHZ99_00375 [Steroidobacteraceae bacterium]|jgi:hypothetical protein|nr:hypothetical protein [Steroidobacteraceae bacterium]